MFISDLCFGPPIRAVYSAIKLGDNLSSSTLVPEAEGLKSVHFSTGIHHPHP